MGKRLYTKDGKNLFSNITLSSAEDTEILTQYIMSSAQNVESLLKQFITAFTFNAAANNNPASITITITNTRGDDDFDGRAQDMTKSYIVLNSVGEYLSMVHPELSGKYSNDAQQRIESLLTYVFYKKPPTTT